MAVKCPNPECGAEFEDGTELQFCDQCGTALPQPQPIVAPGEAGPPVVPAPPVETQEPATAPPVEVEETVAAPPVQPPVVPSLAAKLIVTKGAKLGAEYPLSPGENEIGRWDEEEGYMPHVDLQAQDTEGYVHRRHAAIRFDGSQWWLEHLKEGPSNPTRIRGRGDRLEVGKPVPLQNGDEIVVGRVILKFVIT